MASLKEFINNTLYGNSITAIFRIAMGLLFIYSGFFKAIDLENFSRIIALYDISPEILIPYGTIFFAFLEFILGLLLLMGYKIKASGITSIFLMLIFIIMISINVYRGNTFDCGCFELKKFGIKEEIGIPLIIRDIIILIILFLIVRTRRYLLSIDKIIEERYLSHL